MKKNFLVLFLSLFFPLIVMAQENKNKVEINSIPKKIHYVWVGGEEPQIVKDNIALWKKHMPDYEIKRWDEKNCNIEANYFVRKTYQDKEWPYVSDWCRLEALYQEGGIYLDTDMVLKKSIDDLIQNEKLVFVRQDFQVLSASFVAVTPQHPFVKKAMDYYNQVKKFNRDYASPIVWTNAWILSGLAPKEYKILDADILMLDFGSFDNRGYHVYGEGNAGFKTFGKWYVRFQEEFLTKKGFCIKNCSSYLAHYVLFSKEKHFYIVRYHTEGENKGVFYKDEKLGTGKYILKNEKNGVYLSLKYENGKVETYECINRQCKIQ